MWVKIIKFNDRVYRLLTRQFMTLFFYEIDGLANIHISKDRKKTLCGHINLSEYERKVISEEKTLSRARGLAMEYENNLMKTCGGCVGRLYSDNDIKR